MNFKDFETTLASYLNVLSLEKQIELLTKMQKVWIPKVIDKKLKNYTFCKECKKYSLTKKFESTTEVATFTETTYVDAGYGENDKIGEVTYLITYSICPNCGNKKETKKSYMYTENERFCR